MTTMTATIPTHSGLALEVRPARASDEATVIAFFDRVSDQDRRFRFFSAGAHVSPNQIDPLIHADHFRSESYLAFDPANGELVCSALLACDNALDTAEVAVSVCAKYKGRGIGWALLDFLGQQAEARGVRQVIAIEDRDNHAAIAVGRESGFVAEPFDGDPTLVVLSRRCR